MQVKAHIGSGIAIQSRYAFNPLPPSGPVRQQKENSLEGLFSSVLSQFKKYHPSGNLKFNNLGIFLKLKIAYHSGKKPLNLS